MKKVICFGTFDILHLGHLNYFQQAKEHGDYLIVVIARDVTKLQQQKGTVFSEEERLKLVKSLKIVDEACLGYPDDHFKIITEKQPDVICLGYDHDIEEEKVAGKLKNLGLAAEVLRMKPYKVDTHKSSFIKRKFLTNP
jgi:FAD synthetase